MSIRRFPVPCLVLTVVFGSLAPPARAVSPIAVYGTTAASNAGATFAGGTIASGSTVQLDDGATVTGNIVDNGTLQFNQTAGNALTISNTVSGTGTLTLMNSGTLRLTGTSASVISTNPASNGGAVRFNNTVNLNAGTLLIGASGTNTALQIGASGTGTLNVAGGFLTTISNTVNTGFDSLAVGLGNSSLGMLNISSGTVASPYRIYIGGTSNQTSEGFTSLGEGNAVVNITGGLLGGSIQNQLIIASGSTSQATINVSNGGQLGGSGGLASNVYLGITGSGTINVDNGGDFRGAQVFVGHRAGSRGTLNILSGGSASINSVLLLCNGTGTGIGVLPGGSTANVTIASGGFMQARGLGLVETSTNSANGIITTRTGTATMTVSGTFLANGAGGNNQTGGYIAVGNGTVGTGTSTLTIASGGYLVATGTIYRGPSGVLNLNHGGTLQVGGVSTSNIDTAGTIASTGTIGSGTAGYLIGDMNFAGTLKFAQNGTSSYASSFSGTGDIIKTGTGTVTLSGSNSYTGGTTFTAGTLRLDSAGAIGSTGVLSFNGGALGYTANNTTDYSSRFSAADNQQFAVDTNGQSVTLASNLTNATSSFLKQGSGTATLTGANSFAAIATGSSGGVLAGTATSLATSGSANTGSGSEIQMTVAGGNASWGGQLVGSGTFTKLGAGTLTLTSVTTGSTGGRLVISDGAVVGTTANIRRAVTNNATLTFDQTFSGSTPSVIAGTGSLAVVGSGTVILGGNNSYTGGNTVAAGATLEGTVSSVRGAIANDGKVTFRSNTNGTYPGTMSGTGVLEKQGSGTLTLTGTNTHTGGTVVGAGSLVATTDNIQGNITNNALVVFNQSTNGTYAGNMTGNSSGVLRILGTGTVTLTGTNSHGGGTEVGNATAGTGVGALVGTTDSIQGAVGTTVGSSVTFDQAGNGTYAGAMTGAGTLTKLGGGSVVLTGSNSYAGVTTVGAGALVVNGVLANSSVTVGNGATLGGSGTIATMVTVLAGGTLSPGNSPGLFTLGTLDLQAGSTTLMQIIGAGSTAGTAGVDYDKILVTTPGGLGYGGTLDLDFASLQSFADGTTFDLFGFTGGRTGFFTSVLSTGSGSYAGLTFNGLGGLWTASAAGQTITFSESSGQLVFSSAAPAVPEIDPAGLGGVLMLVSGAIALVERRGRAGRG